jgi:protein involved in polysaccharide export with SLBB domain
MRLKTRTQVILLFLFLFLAAGATVSVAAQSLSSVDVSSLSDAQIQRLVQQATAQGMSVDQVIEIAKARGASDQQIDDVRRRILKESFDEEVQAKGTSAVKKGMEKDVWMMTNDELYDYSIKAEFIATEKAKKVFGFQFFNSDKLSFEPSVNIPVPKDYILGVNDELTISIWGASQRTYALTVDHNGALLIPEAGTIQVQGKPFDEARKLILKRLTGIYSGMAGGSPNTWADVTVTGMRSIKVNVLGEVMVPGTYTLPATASAFNALYLSGGPNEHGSFRGIKILRDNKVFKVLDVYEYLINGNGSNNIVLRDQDVIMVPPYQTRVEMAGSFKRTGYFELKEGENLAKLLDYAGGFKPEAYKEAVSVTRLTDHQRRMVDVEKGDYAGFKPANGDSIWAGEVLKRFENRVILSGAAMRPGVYALTDGMTLSDLLTKAQGVKEDAFSRRGMIYRQEKDLTPSAMSFDVSDVLSRSADVALQREDSVVIWEIKEMQEQRYVRIYGEVQHPNKYSFFKGMTIGDLVLQAGGFKEGAIESYIEVSRRHNYEQASTKTANMVELFQFNINRDLSMMDKDERFLLSAYDYVYVRKAPSYFEQKTVSVEGEVQFPGQYSIRSKKERISDVIKRAGGLTDHAYVSGASLYRRIEIEETDTTTRSVDELQRENKQTMERLKLSKEDQMAYVDSLMFRTTKKTKATRVELQLDKILKDTASIFNYHLREGDRIFIPEVSEEVHVGGAILNPVGLAYEKGRKAGYYIDRSGGFSDKANKRKVYVVNSDGTTKVTKSFIFTRYPSVLPGSKIVVPEKEEKERVGVATWLAIASTFSSLALAVAAILPR